ncbi:MAG TPA: histidine phosphatase family protein [Acidimicrobiia bacterium]|jgi:phosphohistidine phosphatase|nr:histidine phosphatase family protein [Acidimicrobiia bacterium]
MKRLLVMRHAKSDWSAGALRDHDRPLNARGVEAARRMGTLLEEIGQVPDLIVSSSAVRARRTVELAAEAGEWGAPIRIEPGLYGTSAASAMRVVSTTAETVERLMIVGHQPAWGALVADLTGGAVQMKTATVAIIDLMLGRSWKLHEPAHGELVALLQPRHFA